MKTLLIGFDAFDPKFFEILHAEGKTPHLSPFVEAGGYARFTVANPPQSEVSWTSIATGLNPGGHGLFDFVHRQPETYAPQVSLLPTESSILGTQFVPPHHAQTIFQAAVSDGYPATSLWWPATFPARLDSPVQTIPGLGAPDIFGQLGTGTVFAMETVREEADTKTKQRLLSLAGEGKYKGEVEGPSGRSLTGPKETSLPLELAVKAETATIKIDGQVVELIEEQWSPILELTFKMGMGIKIRAVTRAILTQAAPHPILYLLPLQIHPLSSSWPYATPKGFVKRIWEDEPFLTLGWPQDTTALEEGLINDQQFLALCEGIFARRERVLMTQLDGFQEGLLGCVFDSLDRIKHMFWKDHPEVIKDWYTKLDGLVGRIQEKAGDAKILFVSDHGFDNFDHKVHLNRWLMEQGYLQPQLEKPSGKITDVDWGESKAYALGLNSLYLNLAGREGQGIVPEADKAQVVADLSAKLLDWKGPDGQNVVQRVRINEEAFIGPLKEYGPDLLIGYRPPYRASAQTGLGEWREQAIEANRDRWGADHCFDSEAVPGVIFASEGLNDYPQPSFADIPVLTINKQLAPSDNAPPPTVSEEDMDTVYERLKGLGYL